ncbi:MAG: AbfB domain-containing protein [Planctomycetaceae bacterium]|nr:AbfB domain-containing protein [Planctomycetaceae bacterium]
MALAKAGRPNDITGIEQELRRRQLIFKPVSIRLFTSRQNFITHADYKEWAVELKDDAAKYNATYEMVPGLARDGLIRERPEDSGIPGEPGEIISLRSTNLPNHYIVHGSFELLLMTQLDSPVYDQNATFRIRPRLANRRGVSFESLNYPDDYVVVDRDRRLRLKRRQATSSFSQAETFDIVTPRMKFYEKQKRLLPE